MSHRRGSLPDSYFDALYCADRDPWHYEDSAYEAEKYRSTLAALGHRRFARALEIGCSIGVLTRRLASCCDCLLATDVSEEALKHARERCAELRHVRIRRMRAPVEWPEGSFDLVLLSEVLYYLDVEDLEEIARRTISSLREDGLALLVHWVGETDYPLGGDEASDRFLRAAFVDVGAPILQSREPQYRLDLLKKPRRAPL